MAMISAYRRPATMEAALACLARPGAVSLGGGTKVTAAPDLGPIEVVDLQALGLDRIDRLDGDAAVIGATVTLQQLADSAVMPGVIREAARREQPSTLRAQATVGGCVAYADRESELLATLLVHDAVVRIAGPGGTAEYALPQLLADLPLLAHRIITAVTVSIGGRSCVARTARTRADRPIVAAAARVTPDGARRLALTGMAATPILVDGAGPIDPPGDFRGSAGYRRALAAILTARALDAIS
jgi:CO/xanthine dehydrogenase FAD-binding subunit